MGTKTGIGSATFKAVTHSLFNNRPTISLYMNVANVEVNELWNLGYDTGEWVEAWTQKTTLPNQKSAVNIGGYGKGKTIPGG